jgi:hypothetical protein
MTFYKENNIVYRQIYLARTTIKKAVRKEVTKNQLALSSVPVVLNTLLFLTAFLFMMKFGSMKQFLFRTVLIFGETFLEVFYRKTVGTIHFLERL